MKLWRFTLINFEYNSINGFDFSLFGVDINNFEGSLFGLFAADTFIHVDILYFTITLWGKTD